MLAGRLVRIARDILQEYSEFKVHDLLQNAVSLSSQRGGLHEGPYKLKAGELRGQAQRIMDQSRIAKYPSYLREVIENSKYMTGLPETVAKAILMGFPDDRNLAISSGELNIYLTAAVELSSELQTVILAASKFSIEELLVPPDTIGIDILIPREPYENKADDIFQAFARFAAIMAYFSELVTGSEGSPALVYTSTTEPVTGLALVAGAAWGVLKLYRLLLEIAEKQLGLRRSIKELRASGLGDSKFDDRIKALTDEQIQRAVSNAVAAVSHKVSIERRNEVSVAINKEARFILAAVESGARVGITVEALDRISLISQALPGVPLQEVEQELKEQKRLEQQVTQSLTSLETSPPVLLTAEQSADDAGRALLGPAS